MEWFGELISKITTEQIALFSAIITIIIFIINKRSELKYKKYEDKKKHYVKVIDLISKIFNGIPKNKKGELEISKETKIEFFDVGSSLLLYGSKKLYKQYLFFREYSNNKIIEKSKYYDKNNTLFLIAGLLKTIRKEVGISFFNQLSLSESLAFFVNDIANNPYQKKKEANAKYKIRMIKLELFFLDCVEFVFLTKIFNYIIRPIGGIIICVIKYVFILPLVRIFKRTKPKSTIENGIDA